MEEEDFPRGGLLKKDTRVKTPNAKKDDKDLFKSVTEKVKRKRKLHERPFVKLKKQKVSSEPEFFPNAGIVQLLTLKNICPGLLSLGVVKEVHDYELTVGLPNGLIGNVAITEISEKYSALLEKITYDSIEEDQELSGLQDLFTVGEIVRCKVLGVTTIKQNKTAIKLTIKPSEVNANLTAANLKPGQVLVGCVDSEEDHGYVLDLGVKGVKSFLTNENVENYIQTCNHGEPLKLGQHLHCKIVNTDNLLPLESRSIQVHIDPIKIKTAMMKSNCQSTFSSLLPGMVVNAHILKVVDAGLTVEFLSYKGGVHKSHLPKAMEKYENQQKVKACILFIQPTTKTVCLSLLPHLYESPCEPCTLFTGITYGEIVEKAEVIRVERHRGVYLRLTNHGATGFCSYRNLSDKEVKDIQEEFAVGECFRCRVVGFDYVDGSVLVTLKESVLSRKFMKLTDIKIGSVVKCTVRAFHIAGMSVIVANQIRGFVPNLHLADVPLKHPEKKYKPGDVVNCRVLQVDLAKSNLIVTAKRSLVKSSLSVITSYNQAEVGMEIEGFIACIKEKGVLVAFYNRVKGWVNKSELGEELVDYPEKVFYLGQVVRCRVLYVRTEQEKMNLTFKLSSDMTFTKKKPSPVPENFEVGKILECRVLQRRTAGLDVCVLPLENKAYLPMVHLSDSLVNTPLMMRQYDEGSVIKEVMYLSHSKQTVVTHKHSLLTASRDGQLVTDFSLIKPGLQLAGVVKNIMNYGLFIEFPAGLIGLAPNKFVCDRKLAEISKEFPEGTSVHAKVVQVDREKQRFIVSLRLSDCYHGDPEPVIDALRTHLLEKETIMKHLRENKESSSKEDIILAGLCVGEVVMATVKAVHWHHITCILSNNIKGVCSESLVPGFDVSAGSKINAVVLDVDIQSQTVELSLCQEFVKAVQNKRQNRFTKVKDGQVIKGEIILIRPDFALVSLKGHATGVMAYVPVRKHMNDVLEKRKLEVGVIMSVAINSVEKNLIIGNCADHERPSAQTLPSNGVYDIHKTSIKLGTVTKALVKAVHDLQINLIIKNSAGRVHISQAEGSDQLDTFPMKKYKKYVGERINVKVVGFREVKTNKFLPISHTTATKLIPECSTIPSKLEKTGINPGEVLKSVLYKPGDKIIAYVDHHTSHFLWFVVSPTVRGRMSVLNLSTKCKVIDKREKAFRSGQVCQVTVLRVIDTENLELTLLQNDEEIKPGSITRGLVVGENKCKTALHLHLLGGKVGRLWLTNITDNYKDNPFTSYNVGQCVQCRIISLNSTNDKTQLQDKEKDESEKNSSDENEMIIAEEEEFYCLSMRPSRLNSSPGTVGEDPEVQGIEDLKVGQKIRGYVIKKNTSGVVVTIGAGMKDLIPVTEVETVYSPGQVVTLHILSIDQESKKVELSFGKTKLTSQNDKMKKSTTTVPVKRKPSERNEEIKPKVKKLKKTESIERVIAKETLRVDSDSVVGSQDEKQESSPCLPRLHLSSGFTWDVDSTGPQAGQGEISSDSEEDLENIPTSKPRSKKAIVKEKHEEENRLFEFEREEMLCNKEPQTADQFDRLVLQSPSSSLIWLRYMAYHLEMTEIEKARAVAERALNTISFREEQEKSNVWVGYMNLENLYGSPDTLNKVLNRALQQNDPLSIYTQLINIYVKSEKIQDGENLYQTMVKKFCGNKEIWIKFGLFYFKHDMIESARKLLQRSLKSLPKRDHLEVISKFAQFEFKFGESERGKTMFENVLSHYPKRTDLWSVYMDMIIKLGDVESARKLFERVINTEVSVRKMKFFFKKYLDFEQTYGTESDVESVKEKALEYVESKSSIAED